MNAETSKWPWHLTKADVIVRDPHTGAAGEWPVAADPTYEDGHTVVFVDVEDGGQGCFHLQGDERVTVRTTDAPRPLYSDEQRNDAMQVMNCGDRAYIALYLRRYHPEIFDEALQRIQRRAAAECAPKEATS